MRGLTFEDERYVRLYTRDTVGWLRLGWEAQAVWMGLKRKLDRVGLLPCEGEIPADAVAAVLAGWPFEVVEKGIETLLERGWLEYLDDPDALFDPLHMAAEEASKSNALRCKESRERRRQKSAARKLGVLTQDASAGDVSASQPTQFASLEAVTREASPVTQDASPSTPSVSSPGGTRNVSEPTRGSSSASGATQNASPATQVRQKRRSVTQRDAPTHTHTHTRAEESALTRERARGSADPDAGESWSFPDEGLHPLADALWRSAYPRKGTRIQVERALSEMQPRLPPAEEVLAGIERWSAFYRDEPPNFVAELKSWIRDMRWEVDPPERAEKRARARITVRSNDQARTRRRIRKNG